MLVNKRKILNDPVFGFIGLQSDLIFDLIEHPYFQRLRRIKQLGLSCLVYPGANHTRFEHALGALHLMRSAIASLQSKGIEITADEAEAVSVAILLHDIGHGPFSHALEKTIVQGVNHEVLSLELMKTLNQQFDNKLELAICIFKNQYHKKFLHQLVASQLDMDRMDYLRRDSFFSGVVEGTVGSDRIIKMLNVANDKLVVEKKGIYSIEKFLIARRLMYWQVYLHKTVIVAENMLINVLKRAKELTMQGIELFAPPHLQWFLKQNYNKTQNLNFELYKSELLSNFVMLDDPDIMASIKVWSKHNDPILAFLSDAIINRKLFKIELSDKAFDQQRIDKLKTEYSALLSVNEHEIDYFVFSNTITNNIYELNSDEITILMNNNATVSIDKASEIDLSAISKKVTKHYLCYPKKLALV
ncbi:MAG TPA: HD domain-containing protein [Prolixibacteraceae bacterium]|nr:HD domain-containing protein [Prolixibacteraceae bacterium]